MPTTTQKPRILVADDERVIADTLAMILNQSGFEARAVYSGEGALELAESFQPDMLISDVIMADLNGIDAAIRIRALLPGIKILLFSGQAATADLLERRAKKATSSTSSRNPSIRRICLPDCGNSSNNCNRISRTTAYPTKRARSVARAHRRHLHFSDAYQFLI
jgi:CheY-like chemotaxis protein